MEKATLKDHLLLTSSHFVKSREYWQERLAELVNAGAVGQSGGVQADAEERQYTIVSPVSTGLLTLCKHNDLSLYIFYITAYGVMTNRYYGSVRAGVASPLFSAGVEYPPVAGGQLLPLVWDIDEDRSFREHLQEVSRVVTGAMRNQHYPLDNIFNGSNVDLVRGMADVLISSGSLHGDPPAQASVFPTVIKLEVRKGDLMFTVRRGGDAHSPGDLFFRRLVDAVGFFLDKPDAPIRDFELMTAEEMSKVLSWSEGSTPVSDGSGYSVVGRLRELLSEGGDLAAVRWGEWRWSYGELSEEVWRLGEGLRMSGAVRGDKVIVLLERTGWMAAAVIALFDMGLVYVPVDSSLPEARLRWLLAETGAAVVVTDAVNRPRLEGFGGAVMRVEALPPVGQQEAVGVRPLPESHEAAYMIYTSGSTGQPKAVVVTHGSLDHFFAQLHFSVAVRMALIASTGFDISLFQLLLPLLSGGSAEVVGREQGQDMEVLAGLLERVDVIDTVPGLYKLLVGHIRARGLQGGYGHIREVFIGGDRIGDELLEALGEVFPRARLTVTYGPTEGTIFCTRISYAPGSSGVRGSVIGRPLGGCRLYVLREGRQLVAEGVEGEICIAGPGLAQGYLNQPELTAGRFTPGPDGGLMYRSGDLGRWSADGLLEFRGRLDDQLKVRGYRIEPGEIEAVLRTHPRIGDAVACGTQGPDGQKVLTAYYVAQTTPQVWPSISEYLGYNEIAYFAMNADSLRAGTYKDAIADAVKGKVVVDVGTGPEAILAQHCLAAGAVRVYAIELLGEVAAKARRRIRELGLDEQIIVIQGNVLEVTLPEAVDYCVCALVGNLGSSDGCIPIMNSARRFLKDPRCMIPWRSITRIAAIELPADLEYGLSDTGAYYVRNIFAWRGAGFDLRMGLQHVGRQHLLSGAGIFEELDLEGLLAPDASRPLQLEVLREGHLDGFVLWLNLYTAPGRLNDIFESQKSFLPVYFPVFEQGQAVAAGDRIEARVWRWTPAGSIYPDYGIEGELLRAGQAPLPFRYLSARLTDSFGQGSFYSRVFAGGAISERPELKAEQLRSWLSARLPEYMVPDRWVELEALPLTRHGKVDRKALPDPGAQGAAYVAPRTPLEETLAAIWQELLAIPQVGINDNFFQLGGHSLLAMRVVSAIRRQLACEVTIRELFVHPSIARLAGLLQERQQPALLPPVEAVGRPARVPLSYSQERLWFIDRLEGSVAYHIPTVLRLQGPLREAALERALATIVDRHEVLRTHIAEHDGQPCQEILPPGHWRLQVTEAPAGEQALAAYVQELIARPFELSCDAPLRCTLVRLGEAEHLLVLVVHHIASDGWSGAILVRELEEAYQAAIEERQPRLAPLPVQYADYALWQRRHWDGAAMAAQLAYWQQQLAGLQPLELPADGSRTPEGARTGDALRHVLDAGLSAALRQLAREQDVTLYMLLLAAFQVLLYRYSGQDDICVGSPIAGRQQQEIEGLIGFFINTLPLRIDLSGNPAFTDLLARVKTTTLEAYDHQQAPFGKIVETVVRQRDLYHSPLFQVMLVLQNKEEANPDPGRLGDLQLRAETPRQRTAKFELTVSLHETPQGLEASWEYNTALYHPARIARMATHYEQLLHSVVADRTTPIDALCLLSRKEEQRLLQEFNAAAAAYPREKTLVQLLEEQAEQTPDGEALLWGDLAISYSTLQAQSNRLGHYLRQLGVEEQTLVGVCLERSVEMIIGILGILKAGGAYVPIDSGYPAERIAYMLSDSKAEVVLSSTRAQKSLPGSYKGRMILIDRDREEIQKQPAGLPKTSLQPHHLAYIIYTSGSTGRPKGVMVEQQSVVNLATFQRNYLRLAPGTRMLQFSSLGFDASCWEIFSTLLSGGTLVIPLQEELSSPEKFEELITRRAMDVATLPPSFQQTMRETLHRIKTIVSAGEPLNKELGRYMQSKGIRLINAYGPTENTVCATVSDNPFIEGGFVVIGSPISNVQAYVLDKNLRLVPCGVFGEICLSGAGLARGYLNAPELTAGKFVTAAGGQRLYRTGDLGRWSAEGLLEYGGRLDEQVKIRGYRIEPGEIEAAVLESGMVKEAAVVARASADGQSGLVGYVVPLPGYDRERMTGLLRGRLPEYMVPDRWVELEALPLTRHGKVDRKALPDPGAQGAAYVAPRTPLEETLAAIWQELLAIPQVGINDNFFQLGGHSLLAMRVVSAIRRQLACEVTIRELFVHPSIARLAGLLQERQQPALLPPVEAVGRPARVPLSYSQERLWFIDRLEGSVAYHIPTVLRLQGPLREAALERALATIVDRHEVLRTRIAEHDGQPCQEILPPGHWRLQVTEAPAGEQALAAYVQELIARPFELSCDAPLRCTLVRLGEAEHLLVLVVHHIASDGWSGAILVRELEEAYQAAIEERQPRLAPLPVQYADYALWQRRHWDGAAMAAQLAYWQQQLAGLQPLELPADGSRTPEGARTGDALRHVFDAGLSAALRQLAREQDVTLYMLLLAAFQVLLYRYSGQDDICVGSAAADRQQQEIEGLIGFFINTLPLRIDLSGNPGFTDLLARVKTTTLEAYDHQQAPFGKIVETVVRQRDLYHSPLFQVMFDMQNNERTRISADRLGDLRLAPVEYAHSHARFNMTWLAEESEGRLEIHIEYNTALYHPARIARMATHYEQLLRSVVADRTTPIDALCLLTAPEQEWLLTGGNTVLRPAGPDQSVLDGFARQVGSCPQAIALVAGDDRLSYGQLDDRSTLLARHLLSRGLLPGELVLVCVPRSIELIVAIVGILKAGAAFVPVDPDYPDQRIAFILGDTACPFVVADAASCERIGVLWRGPVIDPSLPACPPAAPADPATLPLPTAHDLAYVIYTSGSTGTPKGVLVEHGSLLNYISYGSRHYLEQQPAGDGAGTVAFLSPTFDASLTALFLPLVCGSRLVLARGEGPAVFSDEAFLQQGPYAFIKATPAHVPLLSELLQRAGRPLTGRWVLGGEALQAPLIAPLRASGGVIFNEYGPTEATVGASVYRLGPGDGQPRTAAHGLSIGTPIDNTRIYILDRAGGLMPTGAMGEIAIGGAGLARGYLNAPELTAGKFVTAAGGQRLYRTGDLGRWSAEGLLEYGGRLDEQVKIRGYRIEPGEIEAAVLESGMVKEAAVVARASADGQSGLVGYVVPLPGYDRERMTGLLRGRLPEYMVPDRWVELEALPLTRHGKVDRKALPDPGAQSAAYEAPRTPMEETLAAIWQELLAIPQVGINDNFFQLGGHSLLAIRMLSAIRKQLGKELSITEIFDLPTIASLTERITTQTAAPRLSRIEAVGRPARVPLSYSQERLWFIDRLEGSVAYHIPTVLRLQGPLREAALERALATIVDRHEVLRTRIAEHDGQPCQEVLPPGHWRLQVTEAPAGEQALAAYVQELIARPFELSCDAPLRCTLVRLGEAEHLLVLVVHHIASDGWSGAILVRELEEAYQAAIEERQPRLAPLPVQYADYALWQRRHWDGAAMAAQLAYWQQQLAGLQPLELPADGSRTPEGARTGDALRHVLDAGLSAALRQLAREQDVTLYMLLLAAFQVLLYRYSGQDDICVGSAAADRQQQEIEGLIGFFINTLPLRIDLSGNPGFTDLLVRVKTTTLEAYDHQQAPFGKIVETVVRQRDLYHSPLFQVMFDMQNNERTRISADRLGDLRLAPEPYGHLSVKSEIAYLAEESEGRLEIHIEYNTALYHTARIARMATHYEQLLRSIVADSSVRISDLRMLSDKEELQLIGLGQGAPRTAAQAMRYPVAGRLRKLLKTGGENAAVRYGEVELSYAGLGRRVRKIKASLRLAGAANGTKIIVLVDRSEWMVVALVAVLEAGMVYVPVDSSQPEARIRTILEEQQDAVMITDRMNLDKVQGCGVRTVLVEEVETTEEDTREDDLPREDDLAYVIYTSGSTGRPKGVEVTHGNLDHFFGNVSAQEPVRMAMVASNGFDISLFQVLLPLLSSGTVEVINRESMQDMEQLGRALKRADVIDAVPGLYKLLTDHIRGKKTEKEYEHIRRVYIGGDRIGDELLIALRQVFSRALLTVTYGPTETTIFCTQVDYEPGAVADVLRGSVIGRSLGGTQVYVLRNGHELVAPGVDGEICISGGGVARGYLNRPELTAEKFVSGGKGERMYRTGDLGRWSAGGMLEFRGRLDEQVKIRGYRIEPGEIEAAVLESGMVKEAVVVARRAAGGQSVLVGYVVPVPGYDRERLMALLRGRLPEYMLPGMWIQLEALPLTRHGKLDKGALPEPEASREKDYTGPRNEGEQALAESWQELLGLQRIGIDDNFFELGGDSIITIQVVNRVRRLGYRLAPRDIFRHQRIRELAAVMAKEGEGQKQAEQGLLTGGCGLLPIQAAFLEQATGNPSHFNQSVLLRIGREVSDADLRVSWEQVLQQHDALRFTYRHQQGQWEQSYGRNAGELHIEELPGCGQDELAERIAGRCAFYQQSLDMGKGELVRLVRYRLAGEAGGDRLLLVIHHLCVDGVSWRILLEDLNRVLAGRIGGVAVDLGPKSSSCRQWYEGLTAYGLRPEVQLQLPYWEEMLKGGGKLPVDLPGNDGVRVADIGQTAARLGGDWTLRLLQEVPRVYHTGINDILLSALVQTLGRWSGCDQLCIGMEGHGRQDIGQAWDSSRTVGWFTSVYPLTLKGHGGGDPGRLIREVKEQLRRVPDKGLGYGVLKHIHGAASLQHQEDWEVVFNYLGQLDHVLTGAGGILQPAGEPTGSNIADDHRVREKLSVNAMIQGGDLSIRMAYSKAHYHEQTIHGLLQQYIGELRHLIIHCLEQNSEVFTPSDFGLAKEVSFEELDKFLGEPVNGLPRAAVLDGLYRLSGLQEGLLFHGLYEEGGGSYVEQLGCWIKGLDLEAFKRSWEQVMSRHSILRSGFYYDAFKVPVQCVYREVRLPVEEVDLRGYGREEQQEAIRRYEEADRGRGFDFKQAPLMRLGLLRVSEGEYRMLWTHHHILLDGWSLPILMEELLEDYEGQVKGLPVLAGREDRYEEYIRYIESRDRGEAERYWRKYMGEGASGTLLPFVKGKEERNRAKGRYGKKVLLLEGELAGQVTAYGQRQRVTVNTIMQGVWQYLLSRYTGREEVIFGVTVSGRPEELPEVERRVGMYINALPLRGRIEEGQPIGEWLEGIQQQQAESRDYQYNPLSEIQQWAAIQGDLFDTLMVFENYPVNKVLASRQWALQVEHIEMHDQANYPLDINITAGEKIDIQFSYNMELVDVRYVEMIVRHFENIVRQIVGGEAVLLKDLRMMSDEEEGQLLITYNNGYNVITDERTITVLFEQQASRIPEAIAVICGDDSLTYRQLDQRSNQLGHYLRKKGVREEMPVLICMERSADMIVAMLGVLKAGGCYVPVDPDYPAQRIQFIIQDIRCSIAITRRAILQPADGDNPEIVDLAREWPVISQESASTVQGVRECSHAAYIMYTSGSTGLPKGVVIEHRSVMEYVTAFASHFSLSPDDAVLQQSSVSFDTMVEEVFPALVSGARLIVLGDSGRDLFTMREYIEAGKISVLSTTPLVIDWLNRELTHPGNLRCLISGGDILWPAYITNLFSRVVIYNTYGPTETTVCASYHRIEDISGASIIGRPAANKRIYILGRDGKIAPIGVQGEISIAGNGLARGYLNAPGQTAEKFSTAILAGREERIYRTGDLGRWLPDGTIEYTGRKDDQVKIRGYRVEPGEVEAQLLQSGMVKTSVVVAREEAGGIKRLVGYVVPLETFDKAMLADHLRRKLPVHMLLSSLVEMKELPLMPNGKIDKKALPADGGNTLHRPYEAPRNETEQFLATVWQELLKVDRVGVQDNFFELGGHSLLATRVISAIKKMYSLSIPIRVVFELNTISDLGKYIELQIGAGAETEANEGAYKLITI